MNESLVNILTRLESDIKELKGKVLTLENKKAISFDVKSDVKSIVTVDFITALYKADK
tara:strand:- start:2538 stop:2711 length:174 start_codon:yes stop_codon:yes gene_type:complete